MERTALELAKQAGVFLGERGIENGRLEAELLLSGILGIRRLDLYLQYDRPVAADEIARYRAAVRRRLRREPLQYILGEVDFRRLRLSVDRRALIPRPETEVLVGTVLEWAGGRPDLSAIDIGTGSGAIALSLAVEGEFGRLVATDVSADAIELARHNAQRCGVAGRIEFRHGELWADTGDDAGFDVVVSNPPYIAESERSSLQPEVRDWEPAGALFAGADGLSVVNAIVDGAWDQLNEGGLLAVEIGAGQGDAVRDRACERGYAAVRIIRDLAGRQRIALASKPGAGQHSKGTGSGDN
ncbi:MAG TPA: peptide chain release factor N(5)-glutamine methyltransferase [Longimicrobiales bacterium]|nr:peptide chain release factor N(5)-glutamine methyltransferase [Longimicrobiales bacterium]